MARKARRDFTVEEQLAHGPVDLPFLMLVCILLGIGLIMMFSASYASAYYNAGKPLKYIIQQGIYGCMGLVIMMVVSKINYQHFRWMAMPLLVVSIVLLLLIFTPLGDAGGDARRWLRLMGIRFQPSEVAKLGVILFFAARLSKRDTEKRKRYTNRTFTGRMLNRMNQIGLIELIPYVLVLMIISILLIKQPHMSGTILVMVGGAAVLFAGGIHMGWFVSGGILASSAMLYIITNTNYMTARIELWKDPWSDPRGDGFQTIQSLLAIGSGGMLGRGLGNSVQKMLYIPEPANDFVYPIVVEELGFVGGVMVLILFALLVLRGYWLALHARDKFGTLLVVGITTLFAVQIFLNVGVVTNLIPNTGISLPLFSYGGTALIIQLAAMGMILSVSRQIPAPRND